MLDLSFIKAMSMHIEVSLRSDFGLLEGSDDDQGDGKPKFAPFEDYVMASPTKHAIVLRGPMDIQEIMQGCDEEVELRPAKSANPDPWRVAQAIRKHEADNGVDARSDNRHGKPRIGGDPHDITAWTSA